MAFLASALIFVLFIVKITYSASAQCTPFFTTFSAADVGPNAHFIPTIDTPQSAYRVTPSHGLDLFLRRPTRTIKTQGNVNSETGTGATLNGTFSLLYGRVSFQVSAPSVAGVVTAVILIAPQGDEIDVEVLGGDPKRWQSNIFVPLSTDREPLFGVFGGDHTFSKGGSSDQTHTYTIDWTPDHIQWLVDGVVVRTLRKSETNKNGRLHFPSHRAHLQLGIWDASSPAGTSEWARGPIDWKKCPEVLQATVKSVRVECH